LTRCRSPHCCHTQIVLPPLFTYTHTHAALARAGVVIDATSIAFVKRCSASSASVEHTHPHTTTHASPPAVFQSVTMPSRPVFAQARHDRSNGQPFRNEHRPSRVSRKRWAAFTVYCLGLIRQAGTPHTPHVTACTLVPSAGGAHTHTIWSVRGGKHLHWGFLSQPSAHFDAVGTAPA
jgi:hypothetical protein